MRSTAGVLVDANVLIDLAVRDPQWVVWSAAQVAAAIDRGPVSINPIIFAELCRDYDSLNAAVAAIPQEVGRLPLPYEAAYLASEAHLAYRRRGGTRATPLPDFFIGAHARVAGLTILTRDVARFRTNFPDVPLIHPNGA